MIRIAHAIVLFTCAGAASGIGAVSSDKVGARAGAAVAAYNARPIGAPGWRRVMIELRSGGGPVTRRFDVVNVWWRRGDRVDTAFVLEAPAGLRNTAYLQTEQLDGSLPTLAVRLYLPTAGGRVLAIAPHSLEEGLLDTDFTYGDLCWLLPPSWQYVWNGEGRYLDEVTWIIEARRPSDELAGGSWVRAVLQIGTRSKLMLTADYFTRSGSQPAKTLRVERARVVNGVWTAEQVRMTTARGRSTSIRLIDARLGSIDMLPATADTLPSFTRDLAAAGLTRDVTKEAR